MQSGSRITVAVLRGGPSSEHEISLESGRAVLQNLHPAKFATRDVLIDKDGVWHLAGAPRKPAAALVGVDVVFNALHGEYGEDGQVQRVLEHLGMPHTGSDAFATALAMNKMAAKQRLADAGVKVPSHAVVREESGDIARQTVAAFRSVPSPFIVKPASLGSSVGMSVARDFHQLESAVRLALSFSPVVLVEEFVEGREGACCVAEEFRGKDLYSFLPIEIRPPADKAFFDYEAKYSGRSQEICPGNFSPEDMSELQQLALLAHRTLGLRHYSRSDFIVTPRRGIYFLETNTLPGLTSESLIPKALRAVGSDLPEFFDHVITLALAK